MKKLLLPFTARSVGADCREFTEPTFVGPVHERPREPAEDAKRIIAQLFQRARRSRDHNSCRQLLELSCLATEQLEHLARLFPEGYLRAVANVSRVPMLISPIRSGTFGSAAKIKWAEKLPLGASSPFKTARTESGNATRNDSLRRTIEIGVAWAEAVRSGHAVPGLSVALEKQIKKLPGIRKKSSRKWATCLAKIAVENSLGPELSDSLLPQHTAKSRNLNRRERTLRNHHGGRQPIASSQGGQGYRFYDHAGREISVLEAQKISNKFSALKAKKAADMTSTEKERSLVEHIDKRLKSILRW